MPDEDGRVPPKVSRAIPDGVPCGLLDVGPDDRVLEANATLAGWLGFADGAVADRTLADLLTVGARMALETHIRPMLRLKGVVEELALDMRDANGHRVPFVANARELRNADGEALCIRFALFRAVDRRTYERSLRGARRMAEDALSKEAEIAAFRERFIAVLGHDLRNPLAAVLSGLNIMERPGAKVPPNLLKAMRSSAERAVGLVDSIMDFAHGRLGDGIVAVRVPAAELARELEPVVNETRVLFPEHTIMSDWNITHTVDADLQRLLQLLGNLLGNACHHGDVAQPIRVEGSTTKERFG